MNREILSSFSSFHILLSSRTSGMRPSHLGVQSERSEFSHTSGELEWAEQSVGLDSPQCALHPSFGACMKFPGLYEKF